MFECLPVISEGSYRVFVDRELEEVFKDVDKYNEELCQNNSYLIKAIHGGAITVGEGYKGEEKKLIEGYAVAVQLAVLRLVARELEAQHLEADIIPFQEYRG
jgi:DNA-directed RNA polymerase beta' subunit